MRRSTHQFMVAFCAAAWFSGILLMLLAYLLEKTP